MSILSRLFQKKPQYHVSGYRTLYSAVVTRLTRTGVTVGSTARFPRVEIHSFREQERLDKEGALRQINFIVESISNKSLDQATTMNEGNLKLLTENELSFTGWTSLGVTPVQLQDITETSDTNKIIYRLLQEVSVFLEKTKTDPDPEPEPSNQEPTTQEETQQSAEQTEHGNN